MPRYDGKVEHKPQWLKIRLHNTRRYADVASVVKRHDLHTICSSGCCPNIFECWSRGTATFMIKGDVCTRACKFCATKSGKPQPLDPGEPMRVARSVAVMGLRHAVITSVDRDDLPDMGASHWAATVKAVRGLNPATTIELLIPDFDGRTDLLDTVINSGADIIGHNIETVREITPLVRSRASYDCSIGVLRYISSQGARAKSGIMVGMGETEQQVLRALDDLAAADVLRLTVGQYLQPTRAHYPVKEYIHPEQFGKYAQEARKRGITHTESGPLVRSSYMADRSAPSREEVFQ